MHRPAWIAVLKSSCFFSAIISTSKIKTEYIGGKETARLHEMTAREILWSTPNKTEKRYFF